MVELHHIYITVFASTAALSLIVAWLSWRQRPALGADAVTMLMLGVTAWCVAEAFVWYVPAPAAEKFWLAMTYPGVSVVVVAMLLFAFDTGDVKRWLKPKRVLFVSVLPAALCVIAMTNPGELFTTSYTAQRIGPHTFHAVQYGPLFWVYTVMMYGLLSIAFAIIYRTHHRSSGAKRIRSGTALLGILVPFAVSVGNELSPHPVEGLEAAAFFVTGVIFFYALVRGRLLDTSGHLVTADDVAELNQNINLLAKEKDYLAHDLEEASLAAKNMYELATRDPLTGLYNRRVLAEHLTREMLRSQRTEKPVALVMVDIDDFKEVNDSFSHAAGDAALALVGESLLGGSRAMDIVCRLGGDEFLIIMPDADSDTAFRRAEELRLRIHSLRLRFDGQDIPISVSMGVSVSSPYGDTPAQTMGFCGPCPLQRQRVRARQDGCCVTAGRPGHGPSSPGQRALRQLVSRDGERSSSSDQR